MPNHGYKALLLFLRGLIYLKRAVLAAGGWVWKQLTAVDALYRNTIGFRIFKIFFTLKRQFIKWLPTTWGNGLIEFFGKRGTLQIVMFLMVVVMMIPQSRLYSRDSNAIAGRKTLLYTLVGPGDQDFEIEELGSEVLPTVPAGSSWREGAILSEAAPTAQLATGPQEISSISAGGSALTKPTILPGNALASGSTGRTEVVLYAVQQGDVIGSIATRFSVSVETILWANNLTVRSYIRPGDQLKILPVDGVTHTVKRGDTVTKIARAYGSTDKEIITFNRLQTDGTDIVVGEQLIVPGGKISAPVQTVPRSTALSSVAAPPPSIAAPAGSGYLWPAGVRRITQYYGLRHTGVDIAGPVGTAIYAVRAGVVIRSQSGWNGGYGNYIIIDHGGGVTSLYGHATKLFVSVGDQVVQGQTIASVGSTGRSTGPHLHFEIRVNGARQNPLKYVR